MAGHAGLEEFDAPPIVGLLLEGERSAVLHEFLELMWVASTQLFQRRVDLLLLDVIVFLVLAAAWQTLPWEHAFNQIKQHVANGFEIVTTGLLDTLMGADGGVSCRTCQVLAVLVWDVLALAVHVALGKTEVDDVDVVARRVVTTDQEVVWLDISVDDSFFMHLLNTVYELLGYHQHSFEVELALAGLE